MNKLINRHLADIITQNFQDIDAVFLNGPRQVGKSTFVESFGQTYSQVSYMSFDDISLRSIEINSPGQTFNEINEGLIILDEVQHIPNSFLAIKSKIDDIRRKNQNVKILMTGSADIMLLPQLSEALVGRMYVKTMYPFSASEIFSTRGTFIEQLFEVPPKRTQKFTKYNISDVIERATFPKLSLDVKDKTQWCQSYISTLIERDIKLLYDLDKIVALPHLLSILANRVGCILHDSDLSIATKLAQTTLKRYRVLLEGIFLMFLLPPWFKKLEKRFVKAPKIYFTDTMLLCHILGIHPRDVKTKRPDLYGFVLENLVASELKKQLSLLNDGTLFHLRTSDQKEIDFVIEKRNGSILAIEVKASKTVNPVDFKHLRFLRDSLPTDFVRGVVLYDGDQVIHVEDKLIAMPLNSVWEL